MINIQNIVKSYAEAGKLKTVLSLDKFTACHGEQICLHGASGSGKTTLFNIISGLVAPDAGTVEVSGTDIFTLKENKRDSFRAEKIGYIFQDYNLFPDLTAVQNVTLPMSMINHLPIREANRNAAFLLKMVGLADKYDQKIKTLSGGEKQRVAIARSLASRPEIILADEPTGNLDLETGNEIMKILRENSLKINATLIVITHDTRQFPLFKRVINFETINKVN